MKYLYSILFFSACLFVFSPSLAEAQHDFTAKDYTVYVKSELQYDDNEKPSIKFTITPHKYAVSYNVRRKEMGGIYPTQYLASFDSSQHEFVDNTIQEGNIYEYEFRANTLGTLKKDANYKDLTAFNHLIINTGKFIEKRGAVLILVDETMATPLATEIETLKTDMRNEGWGVILRTVPRTEEFDGEAVKSVKSLIVEENTKLKKNLKAIFILGRVAVPYSGDMNPDGHGDHKGAWPADMYYGSFKEYMWSDKTVNNETSTHNGDANKNIPGDGKFDMSTLTSDIDVAVGRVDFYNMPEFEDSETELLRKYLVKDHKYRTGQMDVEKRALMDNNFNYAEGFGASGFRNFDQLVGSENIDKIDWFTTLSTETYLWSYGDGGGTNISAGGVGKTKDFATNQVNSIFTMMFGSYFGDWDTKNNFLRAGLASEPSILTCSWSARPPWYYHHMAIGMPIYYSTLLSQNNQNEYLSHLVKDSLNRNINYTNGIQMVHIALMGDPTLTMQFDSGMEPVSNLVATVVGKQRIKLNWDVPDDDGPHFYLVYRADGDEKPFQLLPKTPLDKEEYIDEKAPLGDVIYMVREIGMILTEKHGLLDVESLGSFVELEVTEVKETNESEIKLYPIPAVDFVNIEINESESPFTNIEITDMNGVEIYSFPFNSYGYGNSILKWDLTNNYGKRVSKGIYFINFESNNKKIVKKISVIK